MKLDMDHEPIRLPVWAVSIWSLIVLPVAAYLLGPDGETPDWRVVALIVLGGVSVLIGGGEIARAFVNSPATKARLAGMGDFTAGLPPSDGTLPPLDTPPTATGNVTLIPTPPPPPPAAPPSVLPGDLEP